MKAFTVVSCYWLSFFLSWQLLTCCMQTFHNYYFCSLKKKFSLVALILFVPLTPPPFFPRCDGGWGGGVEGVTVWWGLVCMPEDHQCFHCLALCSRYRTSWTLQMNPVSLRRLALWYWCTWKGYPFHNPVRWSQQNVCRAVLCLVWSKTETEYLVSQMWKKSILGGDKKVL